MAFSASFFVFPLALGMTIFFPQSLKLPKTPKRRGNRIEIWVHVVLVLTMVTQLCLGMVTVMNNGERNWFTGPSFLLSTCLTMLLLFTDLVAKCRTPHAATYRGTLTYAICLAEDIVTILVVTLIDHLPSNGTSFDLVQSACTITRATILVLISISSIHLLSKAPETASESIIDAVRAQDNGGYGTIARENGKDDAQQNQMDTSPSPSSSAFWQLLKYIWPSNLPSLRVLVIACFALEILQRGINVFVPRTLGLIVTDLQSGVSPFWHIFLFASFRACSGKTGLLGSLRSQFWIAIGQNTYRQITLSAFEWVLNLSLNFHLTRRLGIVTSALSKGAAIDQFLDFLLFSLVGVIADIVLAVAYFLLYFDFVYAIVVVLTAWAYVSATVYVALYRGKARRQMVDRSQQVNAVQTDAMLTYEAVHLNSAVDLELAKLGASIKQYQSQEFAVLASLNGLNAMQSLIFSLGLLAVSLLCASRITQNAYGIADFVTVVTYMIQLQGPLGFLGSVYNMVQNSLVDAEKMLNLFQETPAVTDRKDAIELSTCRGAVTFSNVSFSYTPASPAIRNFNLTIPSGQSVAIVGESGSGKSTLFRLLLRFYDVDEGSIKVDGVDIRNIQLRSLRKHFGVVPQETILYNDTLLYNVRYANANATEEEVYQACRAAWIHRKIESLPKKYETVVGERGLKLSGGERQRIAIARVVLRAPSIVMLDEATSSLDLETEKQIQASFEAISRNRTSITIAHRLSTVSRSDLIVVLHQGEIVEQGHHAQLLALGGRYCNMWKKQIEAREKGS